jgi:hypothetical protein
MPSLPLTRITPVPNSIDNVSHSIYVKKSLNDFLTFINIYMKQYINKGQLLNVMEHLDYGTVKIRLYDLNIVIEQNSGNNKFNVNITDSKGNIRDLKFDFKEYTKDLFNKYSDKSSDILNSFDYKSSLFHLTNPARTGSDLKVFMENNISPFSYDFEQGEGSSHPIQQNINYTITDNNLALNSNKIKIVELEGSPVIGEQDSFYEYDCISAKLDFTIAGPRVTLNFDVNNLKEEDYLLNILTKGRSLLYDHYVKLGYLEEGVECCVAYYRFTDVLTGENNGENSIGKLYETLYEQCNPIFESKGIEVNGGDKVNLFSTDYISHLKASKSDVPDGSITNLEYGYNSNLEQASSSNAIYAPVSDLAEDFNINQVDASTSYLEYGYNSNLEQASSSNAIYAPVSDLAEDSESESEDILDNTDNYNYNNYYEPLNNHEIQSLIDNLRNRQSEIKSGKKNLLKHLGISLDRSSHNIMVGTNDKKVHPLLSRLYKTNKELFKVIEGGYTSVCLTKLTCLITNLENYMSSNDYSIRDSEFSTPLTHYEIQSLIDDLRNRQSEINSGKKNLLKHLGISLDRSSHNIMVGTNDKKVHPLLSRLYKTKREFFRSDRYGALVLHKTSIKKLITHLESLKSSN